jgi:hypothetical protein
MTTTSYIQESRMERWFEDQKARKDILAHTKRNYELAQDGYKKCIDDGSAMFVKEVNKTAAFRRMKMLYSDTHQILSDLLSFKAFKTGTTELTDPAKESIESYWTNTALLHHQKVHMISVLNGFSRLL